MKLKILLTVIVLILCATAVSAQVDPASTVSITAIPGTSVTSSVTIRATARDSGTAAGLSQLDIYANGNVIASKNCGYSTSCTLSKPVTSTTAKNETYYAIAYDRSQNTQSSSITVTFRGVNTPPNMNALPNRTINEDSGYHINLTDLWAYATDTWTNSSNLTYTLVGQTNLSVVNCTITNNRWIECNTTTQNAFGSSIISVQANDGQLSKLGNFTLIVAPVNDAPVFNATIPAITFAEDTNYTFNISDYVMDVDDSKSNFTFTDTSNANLTIQYTLTGNLTQALLIPAVNFNGNITINFTAYDGENYSNASNNVVVTVTPVNDAPQFDVNSFNCGHMYTNIFFSCDINATDIDAGDVHTFYDNSTLFNTDLTTGWLNFTPNSTGNYSELLTVCDNSGAANNCSSLILKFRVYPNPTVMFLGPTATPSSPTTYSPNATYQFKVNAVVAYQLGVPHGQEYMGQIWLEFNGTNYTTNITYDQYNHAWYYVNFTPLAAGTYVHRWHGNLTPSGLHFNTTWMNYTINKAIPSMGLSFPPGPIITYGSPANVSCSVNTNQTIPILSRNGTVVSNPDMTILGAGTYNYTCFVNATQNYTVIGIGAMHTIHPATVTVNLNLQSPITYGTAVNVTCNATPAAVTPILTRNSVALGGLTDTAVLAAGTYNYTCYYNTTQNYTGDSEAQQLTINQMQAVVNLTLNGTDGDISLPVNGSVIAVVGTPITPSGAFVELYINGTLAASGTGAQTVNYNFSAGGSYPVMVRYNTTQNYTGATETHYVVVGSALAKINIVPTLNSNINGTSITLSFDTNLNTSCRWSLTDQNYSAMTNTFTTTGLLNHSGTITGLNTLGPETIHVACINETAASNSDWNFNVLNVLISTSVNNSTLTNVTATNSVINGSILNNCTVTNSTVKNYQGSNCVIINSFVDPPNPGSDLTGSTITGNSRVMNSNATYSIVTSSNITNSNVNNSQLITSEVENSALDYCNLTNAEMSGGVVCTNSTVTNSQLYNVTLVNAVITNGVIVNGTMIYNGTNYTNGTVANITNLPPTAAFTYSPATPRRNSNTNFNAGSSSDPNAGDTLTYFWDFGDGTNATGVTTTHRYTITGARTVTLTATDSQGVSDNTTRTFTVAAATTGGNTAGNGGGGGGGGGGSSSYYARNWEIDLDARSMELKTFGRTDTAVITLKNKTYTLRMQGISRDGANFTITNWPYSLENYEIKKVDLDNDGYSEIRVILLNNYYTRAQLRFDRYEELMSTQPAPLISGNMSNLGLVDETLTVGEYEEPEKEKTEITEETKDNTTEQEEATKEETASWMTSLLNKIPKDSETIGLGITVAVVIAGLIVYFLVSLILV